MEKVLQSSSTGLYLLAFILAWPRKFLKLARGLAGLGTLVGLGYLFLRYYRAWPMTPMFMGSVAVPPFLAIFGLWAFRSNATENQRLGLTLVFGLAATLGLLSSFFPKDFYLPFLKTASLFSQAHLAFNFLGKAGLFLAGIWAFLSFRASLKPISSQIHLWLAIGYVFWTLSMLTGEVWSYLGWGLPVVWDEPVIVCFMATWFYYTALLHLFVTNRRPKTRRVLTVAGIVWLILFNVHPDLGPLRWPPTLW
ncbi:MAG: cytochrome c biogenesis protein [Deltaproteobacteria bacterium]|jgi:hypothetical protein|nr:cytochrome c biogenesis protein [Deltaproteobacteria bacterium]